MKIRIINENDWERTYELDKSIIRVGSQLSCDIQLSGNDIQPMQMQLVRSGGKEIKYTLRIFADNVTISRGEQNFIGQQMVPYDVLDGDKLLFGSYRMILSVEDEQTRVRSSQNMEAKMYIQKRELSVDSPINGVLRLKNIGADRSCQFRMQIRGIPDECLTSAPLPLLYPGGKSTVGFMISHLQTKPSPGFHTVSIILSAPEDYFGEVLEFRQDIYVNPVFKNEIVLEDDSAELSGFNSTQEAEAKKQEEQEPQQSAPYIQETARMIPGQAVIEKEEPVSDVEKEPVVISNASNKKAFEDEAVEETEDGNRRRKSNKKQRINVIRHDDDAFSESFEEESAEEEIPAEPAEDTVNTEEPLPAPAESPEEIRTYPETLEIPAEPAEEPAKPRRSSGRRKKADRAAEEQMDAPAEEPKKAAEEAEQEPAAERIIPPAAVPEPETAAASEDELKAAVETEIPAEMTGLQPEPEPVIPAEPEPQAEPEKAEEKPEITEEKIPDAETVSEPAASSETAREEPETASSAEPFTAAEKEPELSEKEGSLEDSEKPTPPEDKPVPEESGTGRKRRRTGAKDNRSAAKGEKNDSTEPILVVHHKDQFDFAGEEESPAPLPEQEPEVRFVKRGSFDE